MSSNHLKKISSDFSESDYELVVSEMESITLDHVMGSSKSNLNKTWSSILELSNGDLNELGRLIKAAKIDFRDVIYWATLQKNNNA